MEIKIAGERLLLSVPFLKQNQVREAEKRVNDLFQSQAARFPGSNPPQILAMVAYLLAGMYNELADQTESAIQLAESVDRHLKEVLQTQAAKNAIKNEPPRIPVVTDLFDDETWQREVAEQSAASPEGEIDETEERPGLQLKPKDDNEDSESDRTAFFTAY